MHNLLISFLQFDQGIFPTIPKSAHFAKDFPNVEVERPLEPPVLYGVVQLLVLQPLCCLGVHEGQGGHRQDSHHQDGPDGPHPRLPGWTAREAVHAAGIRLATLLQGVSVPYLKQVGKKVREREREGGGGGGGGRGWKGQDHLSVNCFYFLCSFV